MSFTLAMSPLLLPLLGDKEVNELFSSENEIATLVDIELALIKAQEKFNVVPKGTFNRVVKVAQALEIERTFIDHGMARDGVIVPTLVSLLKGAAAPSDAAHIHLFATSQDLVDTSFMMRAEAAGVLINNNLVRCMARLEELGKTFGQNSLVAQTRMQQALPIKVADRLKSWENNIATPVIDWEHLGFFLQLSGPVGTYFDPKVKNAVAKDLGLLCADASWQNDRGPMLSIGNACAGVTGSLGKIGADIALMVQNERQEIKLRGGGQSSSMAHKQNPVKAEVLVSLARFNAALLSGLHNAAVHEQERSGSAWTLEWQVMPQMICAAAGAARLGLELLNSIESIGS